MPRLDRARGPAFRPETWGESWIFEGVRHVLPLLAGLDGLPSVEELDRRLFGGASPLGIHLEPQLPAPRRARGARGARAPRSPEALYDVRISTARRVPTRPGSWHDLMNALVFAAFPRAKSAIHARQASELERHLAERGQLPNARSRLQDALALLDEGGAMVVARPEDAGACHLAVDGGGPGELAELVAARRAKIVVFGHATLEHAALVATLPRAAPVVCVLPTLDDAPTEALVTRLDDSLEAHVASLTGRAGPPALDLEALVVLLRP